MKQISKLETLFLNIGKFQTCKSVLCKLGKDCYETIRNLLKIAEVLTTEMNCQLGCSAFCSQPPIMIRFLIQCQKFQLSFCTSASEFKLLKSSWPLSGFCFGSRRDVARKTSSSYRCRR